MFSGKVSYIFFLAHLHGEQRAGGKVEGEGKWYILPILQKGKN